MFDLILYVMKKMCLLVILLAGIVLGTQAQEKGIRFEQTKEWKKVLKKAKKEKKLIFIDCYTSWCGPCKMIAPAIEDIAAERPDVKVVKINVDEQPELAAQFRIMSIPTLLVFKEGKVVNQAMGARPKAQILSLL